MQEANNKEKQQKVISSGNPELDSRLGGGLPVGSLILIEGSSGAGKSVLSQQIMWGALQDGFKVSLFTTENTVKSLITQMESIDLDVLDFLLLRHLRVYPIELSQLGENAPLTLMQAVKNEHERDVIVIDSVTSAATPEGAVGAHIMSFFEESKRICSKGVTIIVTLHSNALDSDLIDTLRSMCDAHLKLFSDQDGQRLVKTLQVAKIRGAGSVTGAIFGFEVEPGWGMRVIPISKARG